MTEERKLRIMHQPAIPRTGEELLKAADEIIRAMRLRDLSVSDRIESLILTDTLANRPTSTGHRQVYYATDVGKFYLDVYDYATSTSSWVQVTNSVDELRVGGGTDYIDIDTSGALTQYGASEISLSRTRRPSVTAKATSYAVTAAETGSVFTTTGATGAVTFTLPLLSLGLEYWFMNTVDQNMTVQPNAGELDTMVVFNDAGADSIAFSTAGEKIGGSIRVICDGTYWLVFQLCTNTMTVTT